MLDGLLPTLVDVPTLGEALDAVNKALSKCIDDHHKIQTADFARMFHTWSKDIWKPASCILKPQTLYPQFTATQMAED